MQASMYSDVSKGCYSNIVYVVSRCNLSGLVVLATGKVFARSLRRPELV